MTLLIARHLHELMVFYVATMVPWTHERLRNCRQCAASPDERCATTANQHNAKVYDSGLKEDTCLTLPTHTSFANFPCCIYHFFNPEEENSLKTTPMFRLLEPF